MSPQLPTSGSDNFSMRKSRVLRTIREGRIARVIKLNTGDPKVAEIFAIAQPDALWLCMEHTSISFEQVENQIRAAKIYDVDSLIRVARGSYSDYIRPLEMDATGLIVPHVMNLADATHVRDMTKFAPVGNRPVDGGNNDTMFTRVDMGDYLATANQERVISHQIEDPQALNDLDAIAELEGVDALFFGPYDFSVALGIPGQIQDPEIKKVRKRIADVARKNNKIAATVSGTDTLSEYADLGYNMLSVGADVVALTQYADEMLAAFDRI